MVFIKIYISSFCIRETVNEMLYLFFNMQGTNFCSQVQNNIKHKDDMTCSERFALYCICMETVWKLGLAEFAE